jgi:hypothetical protein
MKCLIILLISLVVLSIVLFKILNKKRRKHGKLKENLKIGNSPPTFAQTAAPTQAPVFQGLIWEKEPVSGCKNNECKLANTCNVCKQCCHSYIPDGSDCDNCVKSACPPPQVYNQYRLYAKLPVGSHLNSVYGDKADPLMIYPPEGGTFYQNKNGGSYSTSINPAFYPKFPCLRHDSWLTIGKEDNVGNTLNHIGIDITEFEKGGGITAGSGTWFVTSNDSQGTVGTSGQILLGQFTVMGSNEPPMVKLNLRGIHKGQAWFSGYVSPPLPSPPSPPSPWQQCKGGVGSKCCNPHSTPPEYCHGSILCQPCGSDSCQCPPSPFC